MSLGTHHILLPDQSKRIARARQFGELAAIHRELAEVVRAAAEWDAFARLTGPVSDSHEQITRQVIRLSVEKTAASGMGEPPVPYAFVLFGSGGRKEQALISDQDNGLIYQMPDGLDANERERIHRYFERLADVIVHGMEAVGYPPCRGNVICSNPRWRGTPAQWKAAFDNWRDVPSWEHVRYLLMAGDARLLVGDPALFAEVKEHYHQTLADHPELIPRLVSNTLYHRVPLGWFGRLLVEIQGKYSGAVNIKNGVYLPFVNCVRLWSLVAGIRLTPTLERLDALRERQIWPEELCRDVEQQFRNILTLRLIAPLHWQDGDYDSNSYLKLSKAPHELRAALQAMMRLALRLQSLTSSRYMR